MLALYYMTKASNTKVKETKTDLEKYYNGPPKLKSRLDLNNKCRVCLKQGTVNIHENQEIVLLLQSFAEIEVKQDVDSPQRLCNVCHKFIINAIAFKNIAKLSDDILKQPIYEESDIPDIGFDEFQNDKWSDEEVEIKKPKVKPVQARVPCSICNKVVNRSYYKEHMTMHDPNHEKYICDVCGKSFRLRCAYTNHRLRHRTDFPFKCQFCPYRGRYAELLKTHMRTHTGDYRYMCTECPARFLFKSNLNTHMFKHKEPQHKCDTCKRAFHSELLMQRHYEADHLGIKNHVCNICGKAFGYRNAMMKHQRHVHNREKSMYGRMPAYLVAEHKQQQNSA